MARTRKTLAAQVDVAHLISAGVLASVCPRALIEEVLSETGRASQRERLLPAPAVVYYVMALALWREAPLEEVLRVVCEGLQWLGGVEPVRSKPANRRFRRRARGWAPKSCIGWPSGCCDRSLSPGRRAPGIADCA